MIARTLRVASGFVGACAVTGSLFAAAPQTPAPGGSSSATPPAPSGRRYVAYGCISRETSNAGASAPKFIITDLRGDKPTIYRLVGDEKELTFHVGHTVEVSGPLRAGALTDTGPNAKALILDITSLTYIAASCKKP